MQELIGCYVVLERAFVHRSVTLVSSKAFVRAAFVFDVWTYAHVYGWLSGWARLLVRHLD